MIPLTTPRMGPDTDIDIPGNSLTGLQDLLQSIAPITDAVEIGAYLGVSSALIAQYAPRLHVVDCWRDDPDYTDCDWAAPDWPTIEAQCRKRLEGTGATIHKMTSEEALPLFADASLDLVYIDGEHSREAAGRDMDTWWPKIRPGGWLAGHDFHLPGVRAAVLSRFDGDDVTVHSDTSWLARKPFPAPAPSDEEVIRRFHEICYERWYPVNTRWMGVQAIKSPLDLLMYQEILHEVRPDVIIETGTYSGGSALFLAQMCELLGNGMVVSIDTSCSPPPHLGAPWPKHPRLRYVRGSSTDPDTVAEATAWVHDRSKVMVILDSDHSREHVLQELALYAPLVSVGSYLIVEDTNINGHPVLPEFGPGPAEAVAEFLASPAGAEFEVDSSRERYLMTMNPGGYLRRKS